jgi:hypothetical protein
MTGELGDQEVLIREHGTSRMRHKQLEKEILRDGDYHFPATGPVELTAITVGRL